MNKTKTQKGITLVALIVIILLLLILAVVAIATVQKSEIIEKSDYAVQRYKVEEMEEKIRLQKSALELAKYTSNQEGNVTIKEVLEQYGEDTTETVKIASGATSIPENMPEGEYYILTPEKYATNNENTRRYAKVTARGEEIERDILKDVYVINEKLEIYYIIEGKKGSREKQDYAKRLEEIMILSSQLGYDKETPEEEKQRIDAELEKLAKEAIDITGINAVSFFGYDNEEQEYAYIYNPENGYFFRRFFDYSGDEFYVEIINVEETDEANKALETILDFKEYLEKEFIGKTYDEIKTMINENKLVSYIEEGYKDSNKLKNLKGLVPMAPQDISISFDLESKDSSDFFYHICLELLTEPYRDKVKTISTGNYLFGA